MKYNIARAMKMCANAHEKQVDKGGAPYILHSMRVASNFTDEFKITVSLVHDVVEDTDITLNGIENYLGKKVSDAVEVLTRKKNQDYFEYIQNISKFPKLIPIKLADLKDNMNILRLNNITEIDTKRLIKYHNAFKMLEAVESV